MKGKTNVAISVIFIVIVVAGIAIYTVLLENMEEAPELEITVNGSSSKIVYLGELIYETSDYKSYYYFHGFTDSAQVESSFHQMLIGHCQWLHNERSGMSNMMIYVKQDFTFHLADATFTVISFGSDWIEIQ